MTICPICHRPMPATWPNNYPRKFCSRACVGRANGNVIRTRNADLDEVAVMRLMAGDPVMSTKAERLEAVRALTGRARSAAWIARQLHITTRSVCRYRAELNRKAIAA